MAKVTEKPPGLPSGNALDRFPAAEPAEIRLSGKTLCLLANPPGLGETITLNIKLHVYENCVAEHEDGEQVFYRKVKLVGCWRTGDPEPADVNQGDLFTNEEGSIDPETPDSV